MSDPRVIHAPDGAPDWNAFDERVQKIVLGSLDDESDGRRGDVESLPADLATRFPNLTHLYLWGLTSLRVLPKLPCGLQCLDVRGATKLNPDLDIAPEGRDTLHTLVIQRCPNVTTLKLPAELPALRELSFAGSSAIAAESIAHVLGVAPGLHFCDLSGCANLCEITSLPAVLDTLCANDCQKLALLPPAWPNRIRRIELRHTAVSAVPDFPRALAEQVVGGRVVQPRYDGVDFVDLQHCTSLSRMPKFSAQMRPLKERRPRTLKVHGAGLQLPPELFGDPDQNRAQAIHAHFEGDRVSLHEVKVLLIGKGRSGKTSLARRLLGLPFQKQERSTHGIRLWRKAMPFEPVDGEPASATATLHLWDFAGQDLYHSTHRLFYQSRAVFVICETSAGNGADSTTDGTDDDDLPVGYDTARTLPYWLDQIAALGNMPGRSEGPPVLLVRTKSARDEEPGGSGRRDTFFAERRSLLEERGMTYLEFDAETDHNLGELKKQIAGAVAKVLGEIERREVAIGVSMVRDEIQLRIDSNNEEHTEAETASRPPKPPHPVMVRSEFEALVAKHIPSGGYRDHPDLLLDLLHDSGFVFADRRLLPDQIVLDQRWAIGAIYTAFERKHAWPELEARGGRCTLPDLVRWGWHAFDEGHHRLFLGLMDSCGMAIPLGDEHRVRGQEYLVLRALPAREALLATVEGARHGAAETGKETLHGAALGRDAVLELLASLGRRWGRSADFWAWGGQFRSHRFDYREERHPPTFVHLDWQEASRGSFGGVLTVTCFGPDRSLLAAVLNECRERGAFALVEVPRVELAPEPESDLRKAMLPDGRAARASVDAHAGDEYTRNCIEVGVSYAGDRGKGTKSWLDLPRDSEERWPRALVEALKGPSTDGSERWGVYCYREEQDLSPLDRMPSRAFLEKVASRDFVFVFICRKYLESEWCMFELQHLFKQHGDKVPASGCRLLFFANARMQASEKQEAAKRVAGFREHWQNWRNQETESINLESKRDGVIDPALTDKARAARDYAGWYDCIASTERFESVLEALRMEEHGRIDDLEPKTETLKELCALVAEAVKRSMLDLAQRAFQSRERARAMRLFLRGLFESDPDGQSGGIGGVLSRELGVTELDDLRREAKESFERAGKEGRSTSTWRALLAYIETTERRSQ